VLKSAPADVSISICFSSASQKTTRTSVPWMPSRSCSVELQSLQNGLPRTLQRRHSTVRGRFLNFWEALAKPPNILERGHPCLLSA
jgi:hypothetical protein